MEKTSKSKAKASLGAQTAPVAESSVKPVRSAKEAINAMYAQDVSKRSLSDYLASSAKEIINAGGRGGDHKSAASLHRQSMNNGIAEAVKPSAAGFLRTAITEPEVISTDVSNAMDPLAQKAAPVSKKTITKTSAPVVAPVIKTSLKLGPKKAPTVLRPSSQQNQHSTGSLNGPKGPTALQQLLAKRRTQTVQTENEQLAQKTAEDLHAMRQAVKKTTGQDVDVATPKRVVRPKPSVRSGLMQDVIPPSRNVDGFSRKSQVIDQLMENEQPVGRPVDSVKRRFKAAPKNYTARATTQKMAYEGFEDIIASEEVMDEPVVPPKPAVEIYGMMEDEPEPVPKKDDRLGVVEDYHPQGDKVSTGIKEQAVAHGSGTAADNNRYSLGGQSPFFLKSVSVEKRPLSNNPTKKSLEQSENYLRPVSQERVGGKNVYAPKPVSKKTLPTKPTVIIPASRKSKAPLILLLLLTVILGAAMGAFAYLCFFQYME